MNKRLAIVIPAHNEEDSLPQVLDRLKAELRVNYDAKVFVVDDGSDDDTSLVAIKKGAEVARHPVSMGPGGALKTGFLMAKEWEPDYIVQIDADGQHDPADLKLFLEKIEKDDVNMVIGSRFLNGSPRLSSIRKVGIHFFTWLINKLTGFHLTDLTSGYRVFKAEVLDSVSFKAEKHWAIEMTMLASINGLKIEEVPVKSIERQGGYSQFHELTTFALYPLRAMKQILSVYV